MPEAKIQYQAVVKLLLVAGGGLAFGLAFKREQLTRFEPRILPLYPTSYWVYSAAISTMVFLLIWFGGRGLWHRMDFAKLKWLRPHLFAMLILFLGQVAFNDFVSPVSWSSPPATLSASESFEIPMSSSLFRQSYIGAKQLDFSGFSHAYWGALGESAVGFGSLLLSTITLIFDLPAIDVITFQRTLLIILFSYCVLASFGFYLYLRLGIELSYPVALAGGTLFLFSNPVFAEYFRFHFPAFVAMFLGLPYALLGLRLAFRCSNFWFAAAAGAALSLPLYVQASHPDVILHALIFFFGYAVFLAIGDRSVGTLGKRLMLVACSFFFFSLCSCAVWGPIIEQILRYEVVTFGHLDEPWGSQVRLSPRNLIFPILKGGGILLLIAISEYRALWKRAKQNVDLKFFLLTLVVLLFPFLLGSVSEFAQLGTVLNSKIGLFRLDRVRMYPPLLILVVTLFGLEAMAGNAKGSKVFFGAGLVTAYLGIIAVSFFRYNIPIGIPSRVGPSLWRFGLQLVIPALIIFSGLYDAFRREFGSGARALTLPLTIISLVLIFAASAEFRSPAYDYALKQCPPHLSSLTLVSFGRQLGFADEASRKLLVRESPPGTDLKNGPETSIRAYLPELTRLAQAGCLYPQPHLETGPRGPDALNLGLALLPWHKPYQRMMIAGKSAQLMISTNPFLNNSVETVDSRFMSVYPGVQALYLIPGYDFHAVGNYHTPVPWVSDTDLVVDQRKRKLLNLAGIDGYLFNADAWSRLTPVQKDGLEILSSPLPADLQPPLVAVKDSRSYGLAYLAAKIESVSSERESLDRLRPPFRESASQLVYRNEIGKLSDRLLRLSGFHDIVIERAAAAAAKPESGAAENSLSILAVRGNKAAFEVECRARPCSLVFNSAALAGWRAFSGAKPLDIQRVNYAFIGLDLPIGHQLVWLEYRPEGAIFGRALTLLGYLILLFWLTWRRRSSAIPGSCC